MEMQELLRFERLIRSKQTSQSDHPEAADLFIQPSHGRHEPLTHLSRPVNWSPAAGTKNRTTAASRQYIAKLFAAGYCGARWFPFIAIARSHRSVHCHVTSLQ